MSWPSMRDPQPLLSQASHQNDEEPEADDEQGTDEVLLPWSCGSHVTRFQLRGAWLIVAASKQEIS